MEQIVFMQEEKIMGKRNYTRMVAVLVLTLTALAIMISSQYETESMEDSVYSNAFVMPQNVIKAKPVGEVVGLYAKMNGVLVLENANIKGDDNKEHCPCKGILQMGDYILKCNGKLISSKEELLSLVQHSKGKMVHLQIRRDDVIKNVSIQPVLQEEHYKLGVWVRDDLAGLGTITMVTENGAYAALGHCVSDLDLGKEITVRQGSIHKCHITDIKKAKNQNPGALIGYIDYDPDRPFGSIVHNSKSGVLGQLYHISSDIKEEKFYPLAKDGEVQDGKAELISNLSGKRKHYQVRIKRLNWLMRCESKDFEVKITDRELIKLTGGIVQGMSGSPIIQNGKIIGALTHVLVKDSTRGYGIFIHGMIR